MPGSTETINELIGQEAFDQFIKLFGYMDDTAKRITQLNSMTIKIEGDIKGVTTLKHLSDVQTSLVQTTTALTATTTDYKAVAAATQALLNSYTGEVKQNAQFLAGLKVQMDVVKNSQKELNTQFVGAQRDSAAYREKMGALIQQQQQLQSSISQTTSTLKAQIKEEQAETGSIDELTHKLGLLKDAYRQMSDAARKSEGGQAILSQIQTLDAQKKSENYSIGNFHDNVGNYPGSDFNTNPIPAPEPKALGASAAIVSDVKNKLKELLATTKEGSTEFATINEAITTFEDALSGSDGKVLKTKEALSLMREVLGDVASELGKGSEAFKIVSEATPDPKAFGASAAAIISVKDKLEELRNGAEEGSDEYNAINEAISRFEDTLSNSDGKVLKSRAALAAMKEVLAELGTELGEDSEAFKVVADDAGELSDSVGDIQATISHLGSDTKNIDALVGGLQGLAAGFEVAQGTAALFGANEEDLQKTMVKVQSAMAIANGVQQIANLLQKESALMLFINTARTKAQAAATVLYTFATGGATVATTALRTALLATGIGAILVLLATAASAMGTFGKSAKEAAAEEKTLNDEFDKTKEQLDNVIESTEKLRNARKEDGAFGSGIDVLKRELALLKARGATIKEIFDKEQEIRQKEKINLGVRYSTYAEFYNDLSKAGKLTEKAQQELSEKFVDINKQGLDKVNEIEAAKLEFAKKQREKEKELQDKALKQQKEWSKKMDDFKKAVIEYKIKLVTPNLEELKSQADSIQKQIDEKDLSVEVTAVIKIKQDSIEEDVAKSIASNNIRLLGIENAYQAGLYKSTLEYEKAKTKAVEEGANEQSAIRINGLKSVISYLDVHAKEYEAKQEELDKVELDSIATKNAKKLEKEKEFEQAKLDQFDKYIQLGAETNAAIGSINSSITAKRIKEIDQEIDAINKKRDAEIESINKSSLKQQEKDKQIAALKVKYQAQEDELNQKKREKLRRAAIFEKGITVSQIIAETALAVVRALGSKPYTPANIGLAFATGAIGLLQATAAAAAPIPEYADGEEDHPGGLARVAEPGSSGAEVVAEPGKAPRLVTQDSILNLAKHTKVYPTVDDFIKATYGLTMYNMPILPAYDDDGPSDQELKELREIKKAIQDQPGTIIRGVNSKYSDYIFNSVKK